METRMPQPPQSSSEFVLAKKQIIVGLTAIFAIYFCSTYFIQTFTIARPRTAADLNGMALYAWLISIPSLAAAFVTLLFANLRPKNCIGPASSYACEHILVRQVHYDS